ncbi:putative P-loop containing nucleoside triphosphate hydrolase, leucine-rich repeat domain superfamily [Helianthus anomalus]
MEQVVFKKVVGSVVNFFTDHITKHLGYVTCSPKHVNNMTKRLKVLEDTSADVKNHMERNYINNKEIPTSVGVWLDDVENIKTKVQSNSSDRIGCLNIKMRYRAGRKACEHAETIEELIRKNSKFIWTDAPILSGRVDSSGEEDAPVHLGRVDSNGEEDAPVHLGRVDSNGEEDAPVHLGRVDSKPAPSTISTPSDSSSGDGFKSRDMAFNAALKFLQQEDNKSQVIALLGMGGVGKTIMMEQLRRYEHGKKMFDWVVKVYIGENPNMLSVQNDIAICIGGKGLHEATIAARADRLNTMFEKILKDNKKKILVILDNVWKNIRLEDIGLSRPLPNGVKLLLTSRDYNICKQIAAGVNSGLQVVKVDVLGDAEAARLFFRNVEVSKEDHEKYLIGCDIVKTCGGLPLAIKIIASALRNIETYLWRRALYHLTNHDFDIINIVFKIFKMSYEHIAKDEDKEIFLHCGLFPADSNIPIEDLTRHAWGLNLLKEVTTLREARDMIKTCVHNLINMNLLINGDHPGCVKMHNLVHAFVLSVVSKGNRAWIIDHSKWGRYDMRDWESCERISLTCTYMSKFPRDFKCPNPSHLQLTDGDISLKFPEHFYENMENLEVIAYYKMRHFLLPTSLQSSTNLRTLILHECKLMFDCSFVGDLINLEVLSFAHCGIRKLPSKIGNLKRLKLLDLTGCVDLHIDDGVFQNLHKLEELYMRVFGRKSIKFTDASWEELTVLSRQLSALEAEFVEKKTGLKNVSFSKLDKFKISIGCVLEEEEEEEINRYSLKNTLKLVTQGKNDILDCKINELFKKTEKLHLHVKDLIYLEDVLIHPYDQHSFCNLRDLEVSNCELKFLFTIYVATGLRRLERLTISSCSVMEALVHDSEREIKSGCEMIEFQELRFLSLVNLPKLVSLFLVDNVVKLPQLVELELDGLPNFTSIYHDKNNISAMHNPILNSQVIISKLEKLKICCMERLNQIWAREEEVSYVSMLKGIRVESCDSLVNLFPANPIGILYRLEEIEVKKCGYIKEIFHTDVRCGSEVQQVSSHLRSIRVEGCDSLVNLFPTNFVGLVNNLEELEVKQCGSIKEIFNIDLGSGGQVSSNLKSIRVEGCESLVNIFPVNRMRILNHLEELEVKKCGSIKEIFNLHLGRGSEVEQVISNLRSIHVEGCDSVVNLFPTNPMRLLSYLEMLEVKQCSSIKEIFNIDLGFSSEVDQVSSNLKSLRVEGCESLVNLFSINPIRLLNHLEELKVKNCGSINLIFNVGQIEQLSSINLRSVDVFYVEKESEVWRINDCENNSSLLVYGFEALEKIHVEGCKGFRNVFTNTDTKFNMKALTDITIKDCGESGRNKELINDTQDEEEIMFLSRKERDDNACNGVDVVFRIENPSNRNDEQPLLPNLVGLDFSVMKGMSHVWKYNSWNNFLDLQKQHQQSSFHNLTTIRMRDCKNVKYVFSSFMAKLFSNLNTVDISLCDDMEEVVSTKDDKDDAEYKEMTTSTSTSTHTTTAFFPHLHLLSFEYLRNLKRIGGGGVRDQFKVQSSQVRLDSWYLCQHSREIHVRWCDVLLSVIPSNAVRQMQKLEALKVHHCESLMEVFETQEINNKNGGLNVPQLSNLKKLVITFCSRLQHVFTFSTVKSLGKLEELAIGDCKAMKVIVKKDNGEKDKGEVQVFHCLKSLTLFNLPNLEGFFLGKNGFQWPLLENVIIGRCPQMKMFTFGQSTTPVLKYIHTSLGKHSLEFGLNFHMTKDLNQTQQPSSANTSLCSNALEQLHWSFHNLIEVSMTHNWKVKNIIPSKHLRELHKLEHIQVHNLFYVEEVFEVVTMEGQISGFQDSPIVVENLRQVELKDLFSLKYIWKHSYLQKTVLEFPNLTMLFIDNCFHLKHVFTSSMVRSLVHLQELHISDCPNMEVIIKVEEEEDEKLKRKKEEEEDEEEEEEEKEKEKEEEKEKEKEKSEFKCDGGKEIVTLPFLKSLKLKRLNMLEGFCLGMDDFSWPSLHTLEITKCPEIKVFTKGHVATPALNVIHTSFERCYLRRDINSYIKTKQDEVTRCLFLL